MGLIKTYKCFLLIGNRNIYKFRIFPEEYPTEYIKPLILDGNIKWEEVQNQPQEACNFGTGDVLKGFILE